MILLSDGGVRATVSCRAASLRSLEVGGVAIVEPTTGRVDPPGMAGAVLAPWPNRVEGARWTHGGTELRLEVTEPELGHANHGLLSSADFDAVRVEQGAIVLGARVDASPGYPFTLGVEVGYRLRPDGIAVEVELWNRGREPAPVAVGGHPYLRLGGLPAERLAVRIDADAVYRLDETHIPRERRALAEVRQARSLDDLPGHASYEYSGTERELVHAVEAADGRRVELRADAAFRWTQFYVAELLATDDGPRRAIAVEPMSAPPNALRTGVGIRTLDPGARWRAGWRILLVQPLSRER